MRTALAAVLIAVAGVTAGHAAENAVPNVVGVWSGPWRTVIFGHNPHHPGSETTADAPRIRDITFTMEFEGQDGRLVWGHSWSDPEKREPFAASISWDGKRITGADTDGTFDLDIVGENAIEACYVNTALAAQAIVATCGHIERE